MSHCMKMKSSLLCFKKEKNQTGLTAEICLIKFSSETDLFVFWVENSLIRFSIVLHA